MEEKEKERWENWTGEEMQEQTAIVYGECKEKIDQLVEEYRWTLGELAKRGLA